jgi:hypothetical protein
MALQSKDEMLRIADEWVRNFCPPNLITEGEAGSKNAALISQKCYDDQGGIISISGLTNAAHALAAKGLLALKPTVVELTQAQKDELAAKQQMDRQQRDYLASIAPQESFEDKVNAEQARKAKEAADKAQHNAEHDIKMTIDGYQCYGVGRVDFPATEQAQKELYAVVLYKDGKRDPIATLREVKRIISELPDHPKLGDVERLAALYKHQRASKAETDAQAAAPRQPARHFTGGAARFRFPSVK